MNGISTIADFYKVSQSRDFARKNQLRVLSINSGVGFNIQFSEDDLVYVKTSKLPTRNIQTSAVPYMGLEFNVPGNVKYDGSDSYTLRFFADQRLDLWNKIQEWTRQVFDDETSTGNYFTPKASSLITLVPVDNQLNAIKKYNLIGVCPKSAGDLEYDISSQAEVQEFDFTLSYHFWTDTDI